MRAAFPAAVLAAVLLAAGCGLPLDGGVRQPGPLTGERRGPADINVLPPGPRDGMTPEEVVRGFLAAQSNPDGAHAIARQFLAAGTPWDDRAGVQVYDQTQARITNLPGDPIRTLRVRAPLVGVIDAVGSYRPIAVGTRWLDERYQLRQEAQRWVLSGVPAGLQLTPADRARSFRARQVYFLAPTAGPEPPDRLVPDQVFLPVDLDPNPLLVARLLAGPSARLTGSVTSAIPPGTRLLSARTGPAGTVTVDLSAAVDGLLDLQRQQLSAQLIWTLRSRGTGFSRLLLLSAGRPYDVPGTGTEQDAADWSGFDPNGLPPSTLAYYVSDGRLRSLDGAGADPVPSPPPVLPSVVNVAAVSPSPEQRVGLLTQRSEDGDWDVLIGAVAGNVVQRTVRPQLSSPSWGSGVDGLWLLQGGRRPAVLLVPPSGPVLEVPAALTGLGKPPTALRVSRDGARIAIVAGGKLYVGRITRSRGARRIEGLQFVSSGLAGVSQLSWETGTSLVALAFNGPQVGDGPRVVLPFRVAVDGSSVDVLGRPGLPSELLSVAAAPGRPLVVGARVDQTGALFRDNGRLFDQLTVTGTDPFYPG